jgi:hypothetical protein
MKRLSAAALLCTVVLAVGSVAAAHEGDGRIEVLQATPAPYLAVDYQVRLTYVADGHGAPDATVTAVAEQPGAAAAAPVQLTAGAEEGLYAGTVSFPAPGDWTVRFTSVTPAATLEQPQSVTAPGPTVTRPPPTSSTTVPIAAGADEVAADSEEDDGSGFPVVPVAAVVLVLAVAGLGAWAMSARRRSAPTSGSGRT